MKSNEPLRSDLFLSAFAHAATGMALVALNGRWLQANDALCAMVGYRLDEITRLTVQSLTHPDDLPELLGLARQLRNGELASCILERRYLRKDGAVAWAKLSASLARDDAGAPDFFIVQMQDTSAQKQAEAHFAAFFALAPDLLAIGDGSGRLVKVSRSWTETLGWSEAELTGRPYMDFVHPDDHLITHAEAQRLRAGRRPGRFVNRYRHKDGGYRLLEWHSTTDDGQLFHCVVRDITREATLPAGRDTQAALGARLLDSCADSVLLLDLEGRIAAVSRSAWEQFDFADPAAVIGRPLAHWWPPEHRADLERALDAARDGRTARFERCQFDGHADFRWWDVQVNPTHGPHDAIDGVLVSARDISEAKLLEAELRGHATHLAQITDSVPATIFQWYARKDGAMGFSYLSENCEQLYGTDRAALLEDWTRIGVHPEDQAELMAGIQEAIRARSPWKHKCRLLLPDGSVRWVRNRSVPTRADDNIIVFTGVILDITPEVLHLQHKERQEEKIRLLVENVSDAFVGMNGDGIVTEWNRQAETLLGWSAQEAIGRDMIDLIAPKRFRAGHLSGFARFLGSGTQTIINKPVERPLLTKSGREVPVEMTIGAVKQGDSYYFATFLRDISERKAFEEKLQYQANHDTLTDLVNRNGFLLALEASMRQSAGAVHNKAVLFIDLDGFKQVNDTFGHAAGDSVLREFARRVKNAVRSTDVVSRFAGDEFAVLLNRLRDPVADALAIAHDILAHASEPVLDITSGCPISASIGIALFDDGVDAGDLMARADSAMYEAKRSGKNRVAMWKRSSALDVRGQGRNAPLRPAVEAARLAALHATQLLDSEPEEAFDRLTRLAAEVLDMPIALIALVDDRRQWFKSRFGLQASETPRVAGICTHTVELDRTVVIEDALQNERFAAHPLVQGEPHIRFYAGVPLHGPTGHALGTLCVIDQRARQLSRQQLAWLEGLAQTANDMLLLRQTALRSTEMLAGLADESPERAGDLPELMQSTMRDFLTGLPNRTSLEARLRRDIEVWRAAGRTAVLTIIDVDNLNGINQALGHRAGDRVLVTLAERLNSRLQAEEGSPHAVARIGGDMFMLLLADLENEEEGVTLLHELRQYLQLPFRLAGRSIDLSCTMGYAVFPRDAQDVEMLFNTADTALRKAKSLGHGSIMEYTEGPWVPQTSLLLEQDLRHALERDQLFLEYQPKVDLGTGHISGFEALVRWRHPERGLVSPADFIPLAEASGLIVDIGRWVLDEACRQLREWLDLKLPGPPPTMAVNLSARQFREPDLVETVAHSVLSHRLEPASLELELTETASMFDSKRAICITHQLHALGVKLSIDDFGTGFSSLSYLKDLAVDKIKIDRSFVTDIADVQRALAVLESIVDTAKRLGLATTAEGVETDAQLQLLRGASCTEYQGFLFSRPIPPAACQALLLGR